LRVLRPILASKNGRRGLMAGSDGRRSDEPIDIIAFVGDRISS